MKNKTALITGVTGQDGSYLAELLLSKGYNVIGVKRRTSLITTDRIDNIFNDTRFTLEYGNLHDAGCFWRLLKNYYPDEIYNLAAQSHVRVSFDVSEETVDSIAMGTLRLLNAYRQMCPEAKFYQASSSEMFGRMVENPADENTPFYPRSPYGVAKLYGHWITKNYRESYDMFNVSGILFNHESERRGIEFVTRKISNGVAGIMLGTQDKIALGNLESKRDWGYAPDYVEAMWLMMQNDEPEDFVIATGETHSIREFLDIAFDEIGISGWEPYVRQDSRFMRPAEIDVLRGNPHQAKVMLGWKRRTSFEKLVRVMVRNDLAVGVI